MQLWAEDLPSEPIAAYQRSYPINNQKAKLILGDRALEIQDLVVISFLFLEKENRLRAISATLRASALAVASSDGMYNPTPVRRGVAVSQKFIPTSRTESKF